MRNGQSNRESKHPVLTTVRNGIREERERQKKIYIVMGESKQRFPISPIYTAWPDPSRNSTQENFLFT